MKYIKNILVALFIISFSFTATAQNDRTIWINALTRIADPVLINLSQNNLRAKMPVEVTQEGKHRKREVASHLEAFGRMICGISPWLELGIDDTTEGKLRKHYIDLTIKCLQNCVNPDSPDQLDFTTDRQALVDAAFLAEGLLRAPNQLWGKLDKITQIRLIKALKSTRIIKPNETNWLLFSATIEAALSKFSGECNMKIIDYAFDRFKEWYVGDSWYGDGKDFHFDYYNSIVIHPMMIDIINTFKNSNFKDSEFCNTEQIRWIRYAEEQERLISPEGTFPAFGRSLVYRFGIFHALSQVSLMHKLPVYVLPSQVRCGLTAVINRQINAPGTFDKSGWLTLGFCGHQPEIAESYISTGSLYMCTVVFLPLGLPENDEFWAGEPADWTNKKAWNGKSFIIDHAIKN